jgi:hypothetical protein
MRFTVLVSVGVLCCAALAFPAKAAPAPDRVLGAGQGAIQTVQGCPRGYRYVPAGYARHGKWRPAQCLPR